MKTMNKILQSLIFTILFFGGPTLMGWLVFDGFLYPIYWLIGFGLFCVFTVITAVFLYGLIEGWK